MERSLTVLLPVQNAQSTLAATVHDILEAASEISERFELLIIDDGSTDATIEVAYDLAHDFPQVRTVRHGTPRGREASIRTGVAESRGEIILLRESAADGRGSSVKRFWRVSQSPTRPARPNYLAKVREPR